LAAKISEAFPGTAVELIPGGRGDFIVRRDGAVLWDKRGRDGGFPEEDVILAALAD
jgi:predicted Rdx family selenoprotein